MSLLAAAKQDGTLAAQASSSALRAGWSISRRASSGNSRGASSAPGTAAAGSPRGGESTPPAKDWFIATSILILILMGPGRLADWGWPWR